MRAEVIKLKIMNKNKRHNDLEIKCNKPRTAHSQNRYTQTTLLFRFSENKYYTNSLTK